MVAVAARWVYFVTEYGCQQPPICMGAATCPASSDCSCVICANPPNCIANQFSANCCVGAAMIPASSVNRLVLDYPACTLAQTSTTTYTLDCGPSSGPSIYVASGDGGSASGGHTYMTDMPCSWTPPYAVAGPG
jgi:hypothetical protein